MKNCRKSRINVYMTTQSVDDLDYRVLRKIIVYAFLVGAKRPRGCPLYQSAIRGLNLGEAWLVSGGCFQKIAFKPFRPKRDLRAVKIEKRRRR